VLTFLFVFFDLAWGLIDFAVTKCHVLGLLLRVRVVMVALAFRLKFIAAQRERARVRKRERERERESAGARRWWGERVKVTPSFR
jgi:hypothetical protein